MSRLRAIWTKVRSVDAEDLALKCALMFLYICHRYQQWRASRRSGNSKVPDGDKALPTQSNQPASTVSTICSPYSGTAGNSHQPELTTQTS